MKARHSLFTDERRPADYLHMTALPLCINLQKSCEQSINKKNKRKSQTRLEGAKLLVPRNVLRNVLV
jgi:hypothetical protein